MKRRFLFTFLILFFVCIPAHADPIKWVDFKVPYASLQYAMQVDISTAEKEKHISWIDILAVAGCRTGGRCPLSQVKKAAKDLQTDASKEELLGGLYHNSDNSSDYSNGWNENSSQNR